MSSLLALQLAEISDEQTRSKLLDNEARLNAMNLIHKKLYLDEQETRIEIKQYLTELMDQLSISFAGDETNIAVRTEMDEVWVQAEQAVAIGLLSNELITNAYKYAFKGAGGEIYIALKKEGKKLRLTLSDNGQGFDDKNTGKGSSFGLKLVHLLARQLGSEIIVSHVNGTHYEMEIGL